MNTAANSSVRDTILLIDDDPMTTELFGEILAHQYDVRVANNFDEAIQIIRSEPLIAVISDYHIGQWSADALFIWLQKERSVLANSFILLTGDKLADLSLFTGHTTVMFKPVRIPELLDTVSQILRPSLSIT